MVGPRWYGGASLELFCLGNFESSNWIMWTFMYCRNVVLFAACILLKLFFFWGNSTFFFTVLTIMTTMGTTTITIIAATTTTVVELCLVMVGQVTTHY